MDNQHLAKWRGLSGSPRQSRELIWDPSPAAKTRLLSSNRTKSRVIVVLVTGHNTMRRQLHLMELTNSPYVGGVEQRMKSQPTLSVSVKAWFHSDMCTWAPCSWSQRILRVFRLGAIWKFSKGTGLH
jgi:hypothetical protein